MKNFGFGCMRLPMTGDVVDIPQCKRMVDKFLAEGFTYFDTAHGYLDGKSETALRECLVERYPRSAYTITNKLTDCFFKTEEDIRPFVEQQLAILGVDYFDYYLLHSITSSNYDHFLRCNAFAVAAKLKEEGKLRHVGISFHDGPALLERILTEHPEIELVQIQFNYADYDSPSIQSRALYDVCVKFNKPVVVMEPCKGGHLVNLPQQAKAVLDPLGGSYASYAIRFAASFPQVFMVLSGMSDEAQMADNLSYMKQFQPLSEAERAAVDEVRRILREQNVIACTACRYCVDGCPQHIPIPSLFACYNSKKFYQDWSSDMYYGINTAGQGKASDCIACGKCEKTCPQHLPVRELLKTVAAELEQEKA